MSARDEYRIITSLTNETIKAVRALHMRKERDLTGTFLAGRTTGMSAPSGRPSASGPREMPRW